MVIKVIVEVFTHRKKLVEFVLVWELEYVMVHAGVIKNGKINISTRN
jgi:hypothetical protein